MRTVVEGFAGAPFTLTWPPEHASAAVGRVGNNRTAHNHLSMRVCSTHKDRTSRARREADWLLLPFLIL